MEIISIIMSTGLTEEPGLHPTCLQQDDVSLLCIFYCMLSEQEAEHKTHPGSALINRLNRV